MAQNTCASATRLGESLGLSDRSPDCQRSSLPQHPAAPSRAIAHVGDAPAVIPTNGTSTPTAAGDVARSAEIPSWPWSLLPQHTALPSALTRQLWVPPATMLSFGLSGAG